MNKLNAVLKFSAKWCGPCRAFTPIFERVSQMDEFKHVQFSEIDIEDESPVIQRMISEYGIQNIPSIVLLNENNELIRKLIGAYPENVFVNLLKESL